MRIKIEKEIGKKIGKTATHNLMCRVGYSHITPRPVPINRTKAYKKNLKKRVCQMDCVSLYWNKMENWFKANIQSLIGIVHFF